MKIWIQVEFFELPSSDKIYVNRLNLDENKSDFY